MIRHQVRRSHWTPELGQNDIRLFDRKFIRRIWHLFTIPRLEPSRQPHRPQPKSSEFRSGTSGHRAQGRTGTAGSDVGGPHAPLAPRIAGPHLHDYAGRRRTNVDLDRLASPLRGSLPFVTQTPALPFRVTAGAIRMATA